MTSGTHNFAMRVRGVGSYLCGYAAAAAVFSGNWWWLASWLVIIPAGAVIELMIERERVN